jgi:hypothetical protein
MRPLEAWEDYPECCEICDTGKPVGSVELEGDPFCICETCTARWELFNQTPEGEVKLSFLRLNGDAAFSVHFDFLRSSDNFRWCGDKGVEFKTSENYDRSPVWFRMSWESLKGRVVEREGHDFSYKYPVDGGMFIRIERADFPDS